MTGAVPLESLEAVVLAGGLGTRLRTILPDTQKVLAPVGQRPFVAFLLDQLHGAGCRRVVLALGHRAGQAEPLLHSGEWPGMTIVANAESTPLGTGGALRLALERTQGAVVLALNGDSLSDVDFTAFLRFHRDRRAGLSVALTRSADSGRYGRVILDEDGRITGFREKRDSGAGLINAGLYLIERRLLAPLPIEAPCSLETDLFPGWIADRRLYGLDCVTQFLDIGTPASLGEAESFARALCRRSS